MRSFSALLMPNSSEPSTWERAPSGLTMMPQSTAQTTFSTVTWPVRGSTRAELAAALVVEPGVALTRIRGPQVVVPRGEFAVLVEPAIEPLERERGEVVALEVLFARADQLHRLAALPRNDDRLDDGVRLEPAP